MLDKGKDADWFSSPFIVALAIDATVGFVAWELTDAQPIVDLSLFRQRNYALGAPALCLGYGVFFGNVVIFPLRLQTQLGYTGSWAGRERRRR